MSETLLTIEDAAARLGEIVEHLHARHETAVITRSGEPMVRLVPLGGPAECSEDLVAFLRRWRTQYPEPDEQFSVAIEESRQTIESPRNPWD